MKSRNSFDSRKSEKRSQDIFNNKVPKLAIKNRYRPMRKSVDEVMEKHHTLDKTLKSELQISGVVENLDLGNIDLSPYKESIINNYDLVTVRMNKEELAALYMKYEPVVSGNIIASELLQNFIQVSHDNHKLLDDNMKLNN